MGIEMILIMVASTIVGYMWSRHNRIKREEEKQRLALLEEKQRKKAKKKNKQMK